MYVSRGFFASGPVVATGCVGRRLISGNGDGSLISDNRAFLAARFLSILAAFLEGLRPSCPCFLGFVVSDAVAATAGVCGFRSASSSLLVCFMSEFFG